VLLAGTTVCSTTRRRNAGGEQSRREKKYAGQRFMASPLPDVNFVMVARFYLITIARQRSADEL